MSSMADIRGVVAKIKASGIQGVPNPSVIASMPGLSEEEKALAINAIYTGQFQGLMNATPSAVPASTYSSQIPSQATQKRDTAQAQVADIPTALFGGKQPEHPIDVEAVTPTEELLRKYGMTSADINPFKGRPVLPGVVGSMEAPIAPGSFIPPVQNNNYVPPRQSLGVVNNPQNPGFSNRPGGSTFDEQVPQAAGGGPKFEYTPQTTASTGPSLKDILAGGGGVVPKKDFSFDDLPAPDIYSPGAAPAAPDFSSVQTPQGIDFTFKRNPFTKEGKAMAADVFAPQYETLDRLRTSADNQYSRSDKVLEQMYQGLANDVAAAKKGRDAEYNTEIADTTAEGKNAASSVAQGYDSGSKVMSQIMAGLGDRLSKVDPNSLQTMADNRGKAMAAQTADATDAAQSLRTGKTIQGDYTKNLGEAFQTQGAVSRENLLNQLSNIKGEYGNRELDINSQERESALGLAQRLSDWDWSSQQANYGTLQDQQQNAWQQANWDRQGLSDSYNNQMQVWQQQEQGKQFGSQQEWAAYQQALQNQIEQQKEANDLKIAQGKAAGTSSTPLDPSKYGTGAGGAAASIYNYVNQFMPDAGFTGDDVQKTLSAAAGFLSPRIQQYTGMTGGQQKYIDDLLASQPNLPQAQKELLRIAADEYWNMMLKTDRTVPSTN